MMVANVKTKIESSDQIRQLGLLPGLVEEVSTEYSVSQGSSELAKMSRLEQVIGWEGKGWLALGFVRLGW